MINNTEFTIQDLEAPVSEAERQVYFMEKAKKYVARESEKLGRPLTFCVTTFGCARVSGY